MESVRIGLLKIMGALDEQRGTVWGPRHACSFEKKLDLIYDVAFYVDLLFYR